MEAIILAGGFGTRLQSVVKDLPKPMAAINGKPFLTYLLNYLRKYGISRFVLSVGYKYEAIQDFFGDEYRSTPIAYAVEKTPLGTGGGIRQSLQMVCSSPVLVVNGDTFFAVDIDELVRTHSVSGADVTLAVKYMEDLGCYGTVMFDKTGKLVSFKEKSNSKNGHINGGVYVLNKDIFAPFSLTLPFSFETDFLEVHHKDLSVRVLPCRGYFIDIGSVGDYKKAQKGLADFDE